MPLVMILQYIEACDFSHVRLHLGINLGINLEINLKNKLLQS